MGCCFSKELNNSKNNERTVLLQKSAEEEASGNGISKTLSSILETVESKELLAVEKATNGAAALSTSSERVTKRIQNRPLNFFHSFSRILKVFSRYENLERSEEKEDRVINEKVIENTNSNAVCVNNTEHFHGNSLNENIIDETCCSSDNISPSCAPVILDGSLQEETSLNRSCLEYYPVMCEYSLIQNEMVKSVPDNDNNSHKISSTSNREIAIPTFAYLDIDHRQCTRDREFYSICVVDAEDLKVDEAMPATMHGEVAADTDNSAVTVEGMCNVAWPPDTEREFPKEHSAQVGARFSTEKELTVGEKENWSNVQKNETKAHCSMDIQSAYSDLLASSCQTYRLNIDSIATDGLRAQVCDEEFPENRTQKMDTLDSRVSMNESVIRNSDFVKLAHALKEEQYYPNSERVYPVNTREAELPLNVEDYNMGNNERNSNCERLPLHLSETSQKTNSKQLSENALSNLCFPLDLWKINGDALLVSQEPGNLAQEDTLLKPGNELNSSMETNTFQTMLYCSTEKGIPHLCECDDKLEEFTENEEQCTDKTLYSSETAEVPEIHSDRERRLEIQTKITGYTEPMVITSVINHGSTEGSNYVSIAGQTTSSEKDSLPVESDCLSGTLLWPSDNTLPSYEPRSTNTHEIVQEENSLELQHLQEQPENEGKICDCSNSFNQNSVSSVSLAHSDVNKVDLNYKQDELWDKCSFHAIENHSSPRTDPVRLVKLTKLEIHQRGTGNGEAENSIANNKRDGNNVFESHGCLSVSSESLCTCVVQKPMREHTLVNDHMNPEREKTNIQGTIGSSAEELSEKYEKSMSELKELELQKDKGKQCVNIVAKEESVPKLSTDNVETNGNGEQLEAEVIDLENSSCTLVTETNMTANHEQTKSFERNTSDKDFSRLGFDPKQVDKYAATPSYEIPNVSVGAGELPQGNERCVLDLMEDILNEQEQSCKLDRQISHDEMGSQYITLEAENGDLTSQILSNPGFGGNDEYLMGYLWNNIASGRIMENSGPHTNSESFQSQPEDLTVTSFAIGRYPYQLLVPRNGDIWGWRDKDECVSILQVCFSS
uniref:Uncharacterized protein n=1 Tax=Crocodylus porosus TaxID=8502 RepID=A0A7M4EFR1_CROPO